MRKSANENAIETDALGPDEPARAAADYVMWIVLAAWPSLMFLAVTNQLCQDVAAVPFLWVVPLAIYLLSFIFCFGNECWYRRRIFNPALGLLIVLSCALLYRPASYIMWQAAAYLSLLAISCVVCHGELVRLKPRNGRVTAFYLLVSLGGALGGLFGAVFAPLLFRGYWELQLSIFGCAAALFISLIRDDRSWIKFRQPLVAVLLLAAIVLAPEVILPSVRSMRSVVLYNLPMFGILTAAAWVLLRKKPVLSGKDGLLTFTTAAVLMLIGVLLLYNIKARTTASLIAGRNFYGSYSVVENDGPDPAWRSYTLGHGRIKHGMQFQEPDKRRRPTTYYGPSSGIGLLLVNYPRPAGGRLRIGVVGLGTGTIAAYGQPFDYIRFYELDPAIIDLATDRNGYFSYVRDSQAQVEIAPGDARISMERELAAGYLHRFDVLAIDAFSSDSIPVHLLTREAFSLYFKELASNGVLAIHISNRYVDLQPVLLQAARYFSLQSGVVHDDAGKDRFTIASEWVLLARNNKVLGQPGIFSRLAPLSGSRNVRMWTDDYSNLFQILR